MRIGWLQDKPSYVGGAERNANQFRACAPDGVEIVDCPPDQVATDVDLYVIHNCNGYPPTTIETLKTAPVIKMMHDIWPHGSPELRAWILENARQIIMVSPKVKEWTAKWTIKAPISFVPSIVDWAAFDLPTNGDRTGAMYLGHFHPNKGIMQAAQWGFENGQSIDAYGWGDLAQVVPPLAHKGALEYADVPKVMAEHKTLVFLPMFPDACPRILFEAWISGMEIVTNGFQGATYWIDNDPDAIRKAGELFWEAIL